MEPLYEDPAMAPLIEKYGELDLAPAEDPFSRLVVSIIHQQLSNASARAIEDRVFDRFQITPGSLLEADPEDMKEAGLSRQKIEYIQNVARTFQDQDWNRESFSVMSDKEVIERLTEIRGVGTWTAKMFLIFVLARPDVFAVEDLGIRKGMEILFGELDRDEMIERASRWKPCRSYACLYLWRVKRNQ